MAGDIYITRLSAWAPGVESPGEWDEWAQGARTISEEAKSPEIAYTSSTFRRRLSQLSKMTIQVIHDLMPLGEDTRVLFSSFRGELLREYQIFKMYREEGAIGPAAFSLSGFNTPVALASIAFGLRGGYSALYPVNNSFTACMKAAEAMLLSGEGEELVFVYADENIPPDCMCFFSDCPPPASFGLVISRNLSQPSVSLSSLKEDDNPLGFLRQLLLCGKLHVA